MYTLSGIFLNILVMSWPQLKREIISFTSSYRSVGSLFTPALLLDMTSLVSDSVRTYYFWQNIMTKYYINPPFTEHEGHKDPLLLFLFLRILLICPKFRFIHVSTTFPGFFINNNHNHHIFFTILKSNVGGKTEESHSISVFFLSLSYYLRCVDSFKSLSANFFVFPDEICWWKLSATKAYLISAWTWPRHREKYIEHLCDIWLIELICNTLLRNRFVMNLATIKVCYRYCNLYLF